MVAWCLMDNHFHLLATPPTDDALPKMMQALGRSYVRYFNDRCQRTGTLWEGRYKSTVIEADRYLLDCMAYIDLNPVRAGMVSDAAEYEWSTHRHYIGQQHQPLVTAHKLMWNLGNTPFSREKAYLELVKAGLSKDQQTQVTDSALKGWALGDDAFTAQIQTSTDRRVLKQPAGRPKRAS